MRYYADLHIHSPYSRATSKNSDLPGLAAWARVKGINLVGTGDFTHPAWFARLSELLTEAEDGFYRLADESGLPAAFPDARPEAGTVRFVLTAEISSIYKRHGKVRKVHNVLVVPALRDAGRIAARLAKVGNIASDGRPILGLDSRDLLEILLEESPHGFLVPAHIWTPWFSLFGSKSGFDTIEDCYGDLTGHIFALETGLSSDPDMNRRLSALDRFTLISNSDCHSPAKLGREQNIFDTGFDFLSMRRALEHPEENTFAGTIEFYPEEGKYHLDGHRKCGVCLDPLATREIAAVCPRCGRGLTIGVAHRVMELADRATPVYQPHHPGFTSLIPLPEVLGEILGQGPATKGVMRLYARVVNRFGSENNLYHLAPDEEIAALSPVLAEAVKRIRNNKVIRRGGYDGNFGVITVFEDGELDRLAGQASLFGTDLRRRKPRKKRAAPPPVLPKRAAPEKKETAAPKAALNPAQERAVAATAPIVVVTAGPGTGKTHTLCARIEALLAAGIEPETMTAITFTNKAAEELAQRLAPALDGKGEIFTGTFHAFCLDILRRHQPDLAVIGDEDRLLIVKKLFAGRGQHAQRALAAGLAARAGALPGAEAQDGGQAVAAEDFQRYQDFLRANNRIDIAAIIPTTCALLTADKSCREQTLARCRHLFVDEFQDVNPAQYELCRLLTAAGAELFVIGDPDQAIYGFRGSDPALFRRLQQGTDLPGRAVAAITLTRQYRSGRRLVAAADAVISHQPGRRAPALVPVRGTNGVIERHDAPTPAAEAEFVVQRIEALLGGISGFSINSGRGQGVGEGEEKSFSDIAICCRRHRETAALRHAIDRRGIPCRQVGEVPFFMQPALHPCYLLIQAAAGSATTAELVALCRTRPGIGSAAAAALEDLTPAMGDSFFTQAAALPLPKAAHKSLGELSHFIADLGQEENANPALAVTAFAGIDGHETKRFCELAALFGTDIKALAAHLRATAGGLPHDPAIEAVTVMTLHAAKGLEFPVVFLCGLEEGLLPLSGADGHGDIDEERRLFYVGMTRARERLILTRARRRAINGPERPTTASRFLDAIPADLVVPAPVTPGGQKAKKSAPRQMRLF